MIGYLFHPVVIHSFVARLFIEHPPHVGSCWYVRACSAAQLCLTLCNPMGCSPPDSSVLGILQARVLEWIAISSSGGSSWPRDQIWVSCVSCTAGRFFTTEPPGKPHSSIKKKKKNQWKKLLFYFSSLTLDLSYRFTPHGLILMPTWSEQCINNPRECLSSSLTWGEGKVALMRPREVTPCVQVTQ